MKLIYSAFCALILGVLAVIVVSSPASSSRKLGAKQCTWGPSYWCSNITNAKNCGAVRHCIQTVWEKQSVPDDNDSICKICLDMVKQARDQLESNETQEDLKAVFEGSCALIPLKPIKKECDKLVDNFIPELVEALASQMNPQVVCSVAGLCNNVEIDKMLAAHEIELAATTTTTIPTPKVEVTAQPTAAAAGEMKKQLSCSGCNNVATLISTKFHSTNRDDVLENMLHMCGKFSSLSDACSNIIISYFNEIYEELVISMNPDSICHMSGVCSSKYHQHPEIVEIRPLSDVGVVTVKDDIPCELCEQLIRHLRDLLVANTTEIEFKQVLEGLCKQTKLNFRKECLSIVDEYYDVIYHELVSNLDENGLCFMIGVCPKGLNSINENLSIAPLLPILEPQEIDVTIKEIKPPKKLLGQDEPMLLTKEEIQSMQLPIDKLLGAPSRETLVQNGELCTLCEYFLHFLQETLATPSNEEKVKQAVVSTCDKLPATVRIECHNFVDMYGDAVVALIIQEIDPSQVCPKLQICPSNVEDMEVFAPQPIEVSIQSKSVDTDKPTCPLCLFAVTQAKEMIKNDKTKDNIKHALENLCAHLPKKLVPECDDFIDTYSAELVEMLITDFSAQQICVYIKLCPPSKVDLNEFNLDVYDDIHTLTNEIPDDTINGQRIDTMNMESVTSPQCTLCERVIKEVEKEVINDKSKDQIEHALHHICNNLRKIKSKCNDFVNKHGDQIATLIMEEVAPKEICRQLGLCSISYTENLDVKIVAIPSEFVPLERMTGFDDIVNTKAAGDAPPCVICEFIMVKLEQELKDKKTEEEIKHTILNICSKLPKTVGANCRTFVNKYGDLIINLIDTVPPKEICQKINLCSEQKFHINDEVIECGVCHGVVIALTDILQDPKVDRNIENLIESGCDILPAKYYGKCSKLITYYGESIINLITSNTDSGEVCAKIGMCFKTEHSDLAFVQLSNGNKVEILKRSRRSDKDELVGSNKCTWGPSYWCSARAKAKECNAIDYCMTKVWAKTSKAKSN